MSLSLLIVDISALNFVFVFTFLTVVVAVKSGVVESFARHHSRILQHLLCIGVASAVLIWMVHRIGDLPRAIGLNLNLSLLIAPQKHLHLILSALFTFGFCIIGTRRTQ